MNMDICLSSAGHFALIAGNTLFMRSHGYVLSFLADAIAFVIKVPTQIK